MRKSAEILLNKTKISLSVCAASSLSHVLNPGIFVVELTMERYAARHVVVMKRQFLFKVLVPNPFPSKMIRHQIYDLRLKEMLYDDHKS